MNNKLIIFILPYILVTCFNTCFALAPSDNEIYEGIDVSGWQEVIDYSSVKNYGIEIVYIKASQGNDYIDPYFKMNYTNAKKNGLKVGFYHYLTARNKDDAINEARFFAHVISGTNPDCRLAMDFEEFEGLSNDEINTISESFLTELKEITNKDCVIYSDAYNAKEIFDCEIASIYPLWVAEYDVTEPINNGKWNSWVGFQYTSNGNVQGIVGMVDRDKFTNGIFIENVSISIPEHNRETIVNLNRYVVQSGNTLWGIAINFRISLNELIQANDILNPNLIYPNQILIIPTSNVGIKIPNYTLYTIKYGDTLSGISNMFNISLRTLIELNDISNPNLIYAGNKLRV